MCSLQHICEGQRTTFQELLLTFHLVGSENQSRVVIRLGGKNLFFFFSLSYLFYSI